MFLQFGSFVRPNLIFLIWHRWGWGGGGWLSLSPLFSVLVETHLWSRGQVGRGSSVLYSCSLQIRCVTVQRNTSFGSWVWLNLNVYIGVISFPALFYFHINTPWPPSYRVGWTLKGTILVLRYITECRCWDFEQIIIWQCGLLDLNVHNALISLPALFCSLFYLHTSLPEEG